MLKLLWCMVQSLEERNSYASGKALLNTFTTGTNEINGDTVYLTPRLKLAEIVIPTLLF